MSELGLMAASAVEVPPVRLWDLLQQGGWAIWPLAALLLALLTLAIHGWRETARSRFVTAGEQVGDDATVSGRMAAAVLARDVPRDPDAARTAWEQAASEHLQAEEAARGQWIQYVQVIATVAPMVGLLGTVSGMIGAFAVIGAGGMGRPELLAGDIGEALITTATGLVIGIPAMVAYYVLRNRLHQGLLATARALNQRIGEAVSQRAGEEPARTRTK